MSIFFNYNGKFFAEGTTVIHPDNRGFRYGDGLFETMKMVNGELIFSEQHFARLLKGMQVLQFEIPAYFTPIYLEKKVIELAQKNNHHTFARIRLTVFRGNGGIFDAENQFPNYIIQSWILPETARELNSNGLVIGIYEDAKKSVDILANIKHNNYLPFVLAALHAKKNKWNDAIVLNHYGRICETSIANIFLIKDKIIYTPSLKEGCVAGVLRKFILERLESSSFSVVEKEIRVEELKDANEIFLSNSIGNIRWVGQMGDKKYDNTEIQKINQICNQLIQKN